MILFHYSFFSSFPLPFLLFSSSSSLLFFSLLLFYLPPSLPSLFFLSFFQMKWVFMYLCLWRIRHDRFSSFMALPLPLLLLLQSDEKITPLCFLRSDFLNNSPTFFSVILFSLHLLFLFCSLWSLSRKEALLCYFWGCIDWLFHHGQISVSWSSCLTHKLDPASLRLDLCVFNEYGSSVWFSCSLNCWNPSFPPTQILNHSGHLDVDDLSYMLILWDSLGNLETHFVVGIPGLWFWYTSCLASFMWEFGGIKTYPIISPES